MNIDAFYDKATATLSYVVACSKTQEAAVIDPVLDYDPITLTVTDRSLRGIVNFLEEHQLKVRYILETHAHADHLTGARELKRHYPQAKIAISNRIDSVQQVFKDKLELGQDFATDGSQFDLLFEDNQVLPLGELALQAIPTPGHTPACSSFMVEDAVFTGDALFMPDVGTGRCDFPAGDASALYDSIHNRLYQLPDETRVYTGHDYPPEGRGVEYLSTIAQQKSGNKQLRQETSLAEFLELRRARDASLDAPRLLLPSIQFNVAAGQFLQGDSIFYLKLPIRINTSESKAAEQSSAA